MPQPNTIAEDLELIEASLGGARSWRALLRVLHHMMAEPSESEVETDDNAVTLECHRFAASVLRRVLRGWPATERDVELAAVEHEAIASGFAEPTPSPCSLDDGRVDVEALQEVAREMGDHSTHRLSESELKAISDWRSRVDRALSPMGDEQNERHPDLGWIPSQREIIAAAKNEATLTRALDRFEQVLTFLESRSATASDPGTDKWDESETLLRAGRADLAAARTVLK